MGTLDRWNVDWRFGLVGIVVGASGCSPDARDPIGQSGGETGIVSAGPSRGDGSGDGAADGGTSGSDAMDACDDASDCPDGQLCSSAGECVSQCSDTAPCAEGASCCDGVCVDLTSDFEHCGACGNACGDAPGAVASCLDGQCVAGTCEPGFADCNGDMGDGCEVQGECSCEPGATRSCYSGPAGTENVGACVSGTQTCNGFGTAWGACDGDVPPRAEVCGNAIDDDCDGEEDEDEDADGDGFTRCGGDCCDVAGGTCSSPALVNPGAFEVDGNGVDDDCDGVVDNPVTACDDGLASNAANAQDYARAIDLCQFTLENPANPLERRWGVISAGLSLASGSGTPHANSRSIRDGFGDNIVNRSGDRLAVLSTGHAADDAGDTDPSFSSFQRGRDTATQSTVPSDWLAANGGTLPNAPGCSAAADSTARNPVMLTVRVRVPTNAQSFSVDMFFFSAEYPEYVCTAFNDFFVTLVDSSAANNPANKNIAIYDDGAQTWPVGINILAAADGLFTACQNGDISQCESPSTYTGCQGSSLLAGTGFDRTAAACGFDGPVGGGTGWLTMSGNVTPGEVMDIRFAIWDTGDGEWDSLVLLDNWQWSVDASQPGVTPG